MSSQPFIRGWCPDFFHPMEAKDGYLVRIRSPFEGFDAAQFEVISFIAERYGNGIIELTNRGNVQLRGFSHYTARLALQEAISYQMVASDQGRERLSNIQISPLAGTDPLCHGQTLEVAHQLKQMLWNATDLIGLPAKFSWAVDGGGYFPTGILKADLILQAHADGWKLVCGNTVETEAFHAPQEALEVALRMSYFCLEHLDWGRPSAHKREGFLKAAGFSESNIRSSEVKEFRYIGELPDGKRGVGVPFGRLNSNILRTYSKHIENKKKVRVTPWRSFVMPWVEEIPDFFIVNENDARLRVQACIGIKGCQRANANVEKAALYLAPYIGEGKCVHVSGCIKGCAYPHKADMTILATGDSRYDFIKDGCTTDMAQRNEIGLEDIREEICKDNILKKLQNDSRLKWHRERKQKKLQLLMREKEG
ncbi:precorrin-3B synthase [Swingsia samuiensis]|uniref:Precorrin-3B synthase n=1 Tax=Swingsia samuiensis TaxID=1293412 RepID=A0A4Y6ULT9_9PROT|nr:precorrin-3B synthase [Swingsia samuiensis]QDH17750.1 precorrin-3B synthase [Swingsia samuiensis]